MSRYLLNLLPAVAFNVSIPIKVTAFYSLHANHLHSSVLLNAAFDHRMWTNKHFILSIKKDRFFFLSKIYC